MKLSEAVIRVLVPQERVPTLLEAIHRTLMGRSKEKLGADGRHPRETAKPHVTLQPRGEVPQPGVRIRH
jgi:2'-5' RNA ligase